MFQAPAAKKSANKPKGPGGRPTKAAKAKEDALKDPRQLKIFATIGLGRSAPSRAGYVTGNTLNLTVNGGTVFVPIGPNCNTEGHINTAPEPRPAAEPHPAAHAAAAASAEPPGSGAGTAPAAFIDHAGPGGTHAAAAAHAAGP